MTSLSATPSTSIEQALHNAMQPFTPVFMAIENESSMHGGFFPGKESHFKITLVSPAFGNMRPVARHQAIYSAAGSLMQQIHALAIHAYTPSEWQGTIPSSPACAHAPK